ncbi:MAG: hypothetical protein BGO41_08900 [Clostridiales bacterium 38-18]|nr:MAG: hypothetical protein BGO41_08900 [Clostridiales bacterium 38-18]
MTELETDRLRIVPLNLALFKLYLEDYGKVQEKLGVKITIPNQDNDTQTLFANAYYAAESFPQLIHWLTSWEIISKADNEIIGSICFKGPPNMEGSVEIGYEIFEPFRSKGYATEAVNAVIGWALSIPDVKRVLARVSEKNIASIKVLRTLAFNYFDFDKEIQWWERSAD